VRGRAQVHESLLDFLSEVGSRVVEHPEGRDTSDSNIAEVLAEHDGCDERNDRGRVRVALETFVTVGERRREDQAGAPVDGHGDPQFARRLTIGIPDPHGYLGVVEAEDVAACVLAVLHVVETCADHRLHTVGHRDLEVGVNRVEPAAELSVGDVQSAAPQFLIGAAKVSLVLCDDDEVFPTERDTRSRFHMLTISPAEDAAARHTMLGSECAHEFVDRLATLARVVHELGDGAFRRCWCALAHATPPANDVSISATDRLEVGV